MGRDSKHRKSRKETRRPNPQWQQEFTQEEHEKFRTWVARLDRGMLWDVSAAITTSFEHPEPGFVSVVYSGGMTGIGFVSAEEVSAEQFSPEEWEWLRHHLYATNRKAWRISLDEETCWQCLEYVEMHAIRHILAEVLD